MEAKSQRALYTVQKSRNFNVCSIGNERLQTNPRPGCKFSKTTWRLHPPARVTWSRPLAGENRQSPLRCGRGPAGVCVQSARRGHWRPGRRSGDPSLGLLNSPGNAGGGPPEITPLPPPSPGKPARAPQTRPGGTCPARQAFPEPGPAQPPLAPSSPAGPARQEASAAATREPPLPAPSLRVARLGHMTSPGVSFEARLAHVTLPSWSGWAGRAGRGWSPCALAQRWRPRFPYE